MYVLMLNVESCRTVLDSRLLVVYLRLCVIVCWNSPNGRFENSNQSIHSTRLDSIRTTDCTVAATVVHPEFSLTEL